MSKKSMCKFCNESMQPLLIFKGNKGAQKWISQKQLKNPTTKIIQSSTPISTFNDRRRNDMIHTYVLNLSSVTFFGLAVISNQHFWNHNPTSLQAGFLLIGKEWKNLFKLKRKWKKKQLPNTLPTLQKWKRKKWRKRRHLESAKKNLCCFIYHHHKQSKRLTWNPTCFPFPFLVKQDALRK